MMKYKTFGEIIDAPIEEVVCELHKCDFTTLVGTKKWAEIEYQRAELMKDALVKQSKEEEEPNNRTQLLRTISDLYIVMAKIEEVATVVEILKTDKEILINADKN